MRTRSLRPWWLSFGLIALLLLSVVRPITPSQAQNQEQNLIMSGDPNLPASVYVLAYNPSTYGIYFLRDDAWHLVTAVPVSSVTVDRVIAKLSPDRQRVAYMVIDGDTGNSAIFVTADLYGLDTTLIYASEDPALAATSFAWYGDQVAYTLARGPFAGEADANAINRLELAAAASFTGELWLSSADGQTHEQIVGEGVGQIVAGIADTGTLFYTVVNTETQSLVGLNSIHVDDGTVRDLLRNDDDTIYLSFDIVQTAPNTTRIAAVTTSSLFSTVPESGTSLLMAALDGSNVQEVYSDPRDIGAAVWSPQGDKVAIVRRSTGEVLVHDLQTDTTQTLSVSVQTSGLQWSEDGSALIGLPALDSVANPFTKGLVVFGLDNTELASVETQATATTRYSRYIVPDFDPTTYAPYVHQALDTPPNFTGKNESCGSASTVMVLASLGKVSGNLGNLVMQFHNGHYYNGTYVWSSSYGREPSEQALRKYGIDQQGGPPYNSVTQQHHFYTLQRVIDALERNHAVIAGTGLTSVGHIVVIIGYERAGNEVRLIVNDPWGNANNRRTYGSQRDGVGVVYTWEQLKLGWAFEVNAVGSTVLEVGPSQWRGEYFNNTSLSGRPVLVRGDDTIDFDWRYGAPASGVQADNFSVRWTKKVRIGSGVYRFTTGSDDGLRIYVDERLVLDQWRPRPFTTSATDVYLAAGEHLIRVEYYEELGEAAVRVKWEYHPPTMVWAGSYYSNRFLEGEPALTRDDSAIKFDWGWGSPHPVLPPDNFSVRWQRSLYLPGGAWQFYTRSNDGSRVYLNDKLVVDQWWDHGAQAAAYSSYNRLNPGTHNLIVDFYEHGGVASMEFAFWPRVRAEYWNTRNFTGTYRFEVLNTVSKNWGRGGPHASIQDNFSSRFTWPVSLRGGTYRICVKSDDGFRFKVDGQVKFERWRDSVGQTCANVAISAGWRTFQIEHYEAYGLAYLEVTWSRAGGTWYGIARPSALSSVQMGDQGVTMTQQSNTGDEVETYFQLLHEQGTLGLGLEAEQQEPSASFIVRVPLVQR
ncbi:PA14 domain-containing protein [Chloroflexus sp.]|uniref:PA14 domain-containing protein n=1 Tax=Chloroflexus sp. TaxID=1904827 RepID=UPI00404962BA